MGAREIHVSEILQFPDGRRERLDLGIVQIQFGHARQIPNLVGQIGQFVGAREIHFFQIDESSYRSWKRLDLGGTQTEVCEMFQISNGRRKRPQIIKRRVQFLDSSFVADRVVTADLNHAVNLLFDFSVFQTRLGEEYFGKNIVVVLVDCRFFLSGDHTIASRFRRSRRLCHATRQLIAKGIVFLGQGPDEGPFPGQGLPQAVVFDLEKVCRSCQSVGVTGLGQFRSDRIGAGIFVDSLFRREAPDGSKLWYGGIVAVVGLLLDDTKHRPIDASLKIRQVFLVLPETEMGLWNGG